MKILSLFLFAVLLSPAYASVTDTIILNAGNNSKVIFYGKSGQDLKNLEKLDLNKIIKELNQRQNSSDSVAKQLVKLDEKGYLSPSFSEPKLSWKQKYLAKTFLNLYVGRGNDKGRYIFFQPASALLNHPTAQLTSEIIMQNKLSTSLAAVHDMIIADGAKFTFSLRYGVGVGYNLHRYVHWTLLQSVNNAEASEIVLRARNLISQEKIEAKQSDFSAFQSHFQMAPKFAIKNAKGQSTFFLSAGVRLNYDRVFEHFDPAAYSAGMSVNATRGIISTFHGPVISGGGYSVYSRKNNFGTSYIAEAGYKWIGLFVNLYPENVVLTTKLIGKTERPDSGFIKDKKGKIGYVSFGIKLGR